MSQAAASKRGWTWTDSHGLDQPCTESVLSPTKPNAPILSSGADSYLHNLVDEVSGLFKQPTTHPDSVPTPAAKHWTLSDMACEPTDDIALRLFFVNDVYEAESHADGSGGLGEAASILNKHRLACEAVGVPHLTAVCGDFLSASHLAVAYEGAHMIPILEALGTDVVCVGNHEWDFGWRVLQKRMQESTFPWLGGNVVMPTDDESHAKDARAQLRSGCILLLDSGIRLGLFGLCTPETPGLSNPGCGVHFLDPVACAAHIADQLAGHVDAIVGLTHLSLSEDIRVAQATRVHPIAAILGGHEHQPFVSLPSSIEEMPSKSSGPVIFKAGCDARWIGVVDILKSQLNKARCFLVPNKGADIDTAVHGIFHKLSESADEVAKLPLARLPISLVSEPFEKLERRDALIKTSSFLLDTRFPMIRTRETLFGNLVANALQASFPGAQIVVVNSGTIRGNRLYEPGTVFHVKDLQREFPFPNTAVLVQMSGSQIRRMFELAMRGLENKAGYFLQVSGLVIEYKPNELAMRRVQKITMQGKELEAEQMYSVVVSEYMRNGGDGYDVFKSAPILESPSNDRVISALVREYMETRKELDITDCEPLGRLIRIED